MRIMLYAYTGRGNTAGSIPHVARVKLAHETCRIDRDIPQEFQFQKSSPHYETVRIAQGNFMRIFAKSNLIGYSLMTLMDRRPRSL